MTMSDAATQLRAEASEDDGLPSIVKLDSALCSVEREMMQCALSEAVSKDFDPTVLQFSYTDGLGRALLRSRPRSRFSLWAFHWAPGVATPIHDHHCACAFSVVAGELEERVYREIEAGKVEVTRRFARRAGPVCALRQDAGYIHSMHNTAAVDAYSIHLYAFDPATVPNSVRTKFAPCS